MSDDFIVRFMAAINRGEQLHPGPYTMVEWHNDLIEEVDEIRYELGLAGDLDRLRDELIDLAVVACRFAEACDRDKLK